MNTNSISYINSQSENVTLDPSGTDYIDYSNNAAYFHDAHGINPNDENSTSLVVQKNDSPFFLSSLAEFTWVFKYKLNSINTTSIVDQFFNNVNYDVSFSNTSLFVGETLDVHVLKASHDSITYTISGDLTSADLSNADLTGTISATETTLSYPIVSGNGQFRFLLDNTDISNNATILLKYWVKTVTNWAGDVVFAFASSPSGTYYDQPDLSFNTGDVVYFDVSNTSGYNLVFGTVLDDNTTLVTSNYSETDNVITLDLTSYSGTTVYYFEDSSANMGYVEATTTSTYNVLFKDIYPTELSHPDEPRTIMYLNAPNFNQKVYPGRGGYKSNSFTGSLLKNLSYYEYLWDGILYHILIRITVGETLVKTLTFNDFYYRSFQDNNLQIRIGINTVNDVMYELTSKITSSGSLTNNFTNLFTANTTYTSTKYNDLTDTTGTSSTECQLYNNTITFSTPTPIRCIYITNIEQKEIYVSYDGDTRGIAVTDVSVLPSYQVTVANGVFVIDGVSKPEITFTNGQTYVFDQSDSTNAGFPIVFGTSPESSTLYTTGVTVVGTPGQAGAYTKLVYTGTTGALYYYSTGGSLMGYFNGYIVKTVQNWTGQDVFSIKSPDESDYIVQPDLSFNAGDTALFYVGDSSMTGYSLVFGTVVDDNTTLVTSNYSETDNLITLDLTGYSGTTVYYFEDTSANMGYVDAPAPILTAPTTYDVLFKDIYPTELSHPDEPRTIMFLSSNNITTKEYFGRGGYKNSGLTGSLLKNLSHYEFVDGGVTYHALIRITVGEGLVGTLTFNDFYYRGYNQNEIQIRIGINTVNDVMYEITSNITTASSSTNNFTNLFTANTTYTSTKYNDLTDTTGTSSTECELYNNTITFSTPTPIRCIYITTVEQYNMWLSYNGDTRGIAVTEGIPVILSYSVTVANGVFVIDGVSKDNITFTNGETYVFDQSDSTNAGFPIVFGTSPESSSLYTTGVTVVGTPGQAGAYTKLVYTGTTGALYYYSTGGTLMGYFNGYAVKTVQNWTGQTVFSIKSPNESDFVAQPDLSFNAGDTALFYVGDSSMTGYSLVFGTVLDDNTTLVTSNYSETDNLITLDLTGYSGTTVYYFEDTSANMGYVDAPDPNIATNFSNTSQISAGSATGNYNNRTWNQTQYGDFTDGSYNVITSTIIASYEYPVNHMAETLLIESSDRSVYRSFKDLGDTYDYNPTNGATANANINTIVDGTNYYGAYAQVTMPYKLVLKDIYVRGRYVPTSPDEYHGREMMPKKVFIFGSNDNGTTLTFLKEDEIPRSSDFTNISSKAISGITEAYSTIRMVVNSIWSTTYSKDLIVNHLRFTGDIIDANTTEHTVTVSNGVFVIDGVSKDNITFTNGQTYVFDQSDSTNAGFPIVFGETPESSSLYTTGVTVVGTPGQAGAYTKLVYTGTTGALYYYSTGGSLMGYFNGYIVKTVQNWTGQDVFTIKSPNESDYIVQPDLSFNAGDTALFYVGDSSMTGYSLVFGTVLDDNSTLVTSNYSETDNLITLDLTGYSGGAVYYFEDSSANMGYVEAPAPSASDPNLPNLKIYINAQSDNRSGTSITNLVDSTNNATNEGDVNYYADIGGRGSYYLPYGQSGLNNASVKLPDVLTSNPSNELTSFTFSIYYYTTADTLQGHTRILGSSHGLTQANGHIRSIHIGTSVTRIGGVGDPGIHIYADSGALISKPGTTPYNNWHHMCVTHDGTTSILYLNGVNIGSSTNTLTMVEPLLLGGYYDGNSNYTSFAGYYFDAVHVYDTVLTASEVTALYNNPYVSTTTVIIYPVTVANGVFVIDGVSKPEITFTNGETYVFDQSDSTNAGFPIVFGETPESSSLYTTGVTVVGTPGQAGAYTKLEYTGTTGDLYYYNNIIPGMGNDSNTISYNVTVADTPPKFYLNSALQVVTFTANTKYYFYQYDSTNENYPIVFDETADDAAPYFTDGVTTVGTPGQSGAYTILDLSDGFTGPLVYFSSGAANMGFSEVYTVKVVQNWAGSNVFSIQAPGEDISYNQPDLSFNAGDNVLFDVGDSSMTGYSLVFGTEIDNSGTILGSSYVSQSETLINLNLPSDYTGGAVYYFENTNAGMGYVEATTTTTTTTTTDTITNITNIDPSNSSRTYSDYLHTAGSGMLNDSTLGGGRAWALSFAKKDSVNENVIINCGSVITIVGLRLRERGDYPQYVKTLTIDYSSDGSTYYNVDDGNIFDATAESGNKDFSFNTPVSARYIKITPKTYYNHPSMRAGLIQGTITTTTTTTTTITALDSYTVTVSGGAFFIDTGSGAQSKPEITFTDGETYVFDQSDSTNAGYPIVFGETNDSTPYYTTGVTVVGTPGQPGAYTRIDYTGSTALYYFSSGATGMGYASLLATNYNIISGMTFSGVAGSVNNRYWTQTGGTDSFTNGTYMVSYPTSGHNGQNSENLFNNNTNHAFYAQGYYTNGNATTTGIFAVTTASSQSYHGSYVQITLPYKLVLKQIDIVGQVASGLDLRTRTPYTVYLFGSNDGGTNFTYLGVNDFPYPSSSTDNATSITITTITEGYYTIRMVINKTQDANTGISHTSGYGNTASALSQWHLIGDVVPQPTPTWTLLFRQTYGYGWSVNPATNSLNESDTSLENYSIINSLYGTTNYKNGDFYQFKYIDKTNNETVEWKQTSNFVETNNSVTGYELISSTINPVPNNFGGLAISASSSNTYYDGNPGINHWFYPIGQKSTTFGSIPAFESPYAQEIELWVYS